jgi:hypothetical protein
VGAYCIAGIPIAVESACDDPLLDTMLRAYLRPFALAGHSFPPGSPPPIAFRLLVPSAEERRRGRAVYALLLRDGHLVRQAASLFGLVDALEWELGGTVIARHPAMLALHAAAIARYRRALIVPAASGTGKTSLACALLRAGCAYLSDEAAMIDPCTREVHPFLKPLSIKRLDWLNQHVGPLTEDPSAWVASTSAARRIHADAFATCQTAPVPVGWIVVPRGRTTGAPQIAPLPRVEALRALLANCLNADIHARRAAATLTGLVAGAACYAVTLGSPEETARQLCSLMELPAP